MLEGMKIDWSVRELVETREYPSHPRRDKSSGETSIPKRKHPSRFAS